MEVKLTHETETETKITKPMRLVSRDEMGRYTQLALRVHSNFSYGAMGPPCPSSSYILHLDFCFLDIDLKCLLASRMATLAFGFADHYFQPSQWGICSFQRMEQIQFKTITKYWLLGLLNVYTIRYIFHVTPLFLVPKPNLPPSSSLIRPIHCQSISDVLLPHVRKLEEVICEEFQLNGGRPEFYMAFEVLP